MASRELVWITADGSEFRLTDWMTGYRVTKGATGLGRAPIELSTDDTPLLDGVEVTDEYAPPRTIQLPMLILADTRAAFRARVRALVTAFARGDGCALELRQEDGQRRRIMARYNGGLEGVEDKDTGGETWYRCVIKLLCPDPYWFDPVPIVYTYEFVGTPVPFLGDPFLPLNISPGEVIGPTTITNPGEVLSWPVWTIHPPADELVLTDVDNGASIPIAAAVPDGLTLSIVTQPGLTDVRLSDGTDYWPALYGSPEFWSIPPGTTNVDLDLTTPGPGSKVELSFYARYESAW